MLIPVICWKMKKTQTTINALFTPGVHCDLCCLRSLVSVAASCSALRRYPESAREVGDRSIRRSGTAKRRATCRDGDQGTQTTQVAVDPWGEKGVDGGLRLLLLPTDHRYQHPVLLWPAAAHRTI